MTDQDIKASAEGRVTHSVLAAYADEAVPQSSDDGNSDMDYELCNDKIWLDFSIGCGRCERCLGSSAENKSRLNVMVYVRESI